tara:strand:+ start:421 stop:882 length:462 start_codon:yes stop_codon:yes gene_type:complete
MISKKEIYLYQEKWANGIVSIGKLKDDYVQCKKKTLKFISNLYGFENGTVQFKPTKASDNQFRNNIESALSYFIGGNDSFIEDTGFATNPWSRVEFKNESINIIENIATAMGNYFFTDIKGNTIKVEYSFVYKKIGDSIKIILHHSSLPYNPD